ncbi:MAG: single-strand DNA-binding protein [Candidatus Azotimanducaceae bacterium]|jgi:single-strand DNA-binding protein
MYELSGTVKIIFEEQTFGSGFNKREFVVTSGDDKYPQEIKFECLKEKVELVNNLKQGDKVKVTFDINGREWNEKYFVNLKAFRIETAGGSSSDSSDEPPPFDPADEILDEEPPF